MYSPKELVRDSSITLRTAQRILHVAWENKKTSAIILGERLHFTRTSEGKRSSYLIYEESYIRFRKLITTKTTK